MTDLATLRAQRDTLDAAIKAAELVRQDEMREARKQFVSTYDWWVEQTEPYVYRFQRKYDEATIAAREAFKERFGQLPNAGFADEDKIQSMSHYLVDRVLISTGGGYVVVIESREGKRTSSWHRILELTMDEVIDIKKGVFPESLRNC